MRKYIIAIAVFVSALAVSGQDVIWKMTYDVGIPFGETRDFTAPVSWRGLSLDVDRFVNDNLAVGMGFGWSTFFEYEDHASYQAGEVLMTGTQQRYINNIPLTGKISYYLDSDLLEPYFSMGIGTVWQETRREVGLWSFTDSYWQFVLAPEVGVVFPLDYSYLTARLRYTHAFETQGGAPTLSYLSIGLGIAW